MPSLLTHHLFGQKVLRLYGRAFEENINTQDAFIIGCQGPDPFFFCFIGPKPHTYIRFGQKLHIVKVEQSLEEMRRYLGKCPRAEKEIIRAYLTGYLCHFSLDVTAHPYVYAVQKRENEAMGFFDKDTARVHARLETAIDTLLGQTAVNPHRLLPCNKTVCMAIGKMYRKLAKSLYGTILPENCFWRAVKSVRTGEHFLRSRYGIKRAVLPKAERLISRHSMYEAMSYSPDTKGISDPLNERHSEWISRADGFVHCDSFPELFEQAVSKAKRNIDAYFNGEPVHVITRGLDFNGDPEKQPQKAD